MNELNKKKKRFKKFKSQRLDRWNRGAILIATITGIVGICNICYTSYLNYKLNKLNYSPQLVVTKCQLTELKKTGSNTPQYAFYSTRVNATVKNIGNNNAHLMLEVYICIPTGRDFLRKEKNENQFAKDNRNGPPEYYFDKQIYPNQEIIVSPLVENLNSADSIITLHFLFIYKNDNNIIYDSYYWYSCRIKDNSENPINFVSENNSFHVYGIWESHRMNNIYSRISKKKVAPTN